jgi:hypothetical protein
MYIRKHELTIDSDLLFTNGQRAIECLHRLQGRKPTDITPLFALRDYLDCSMIQHDGLNQERVAMAQDAIRSCLVGELLRYHCSQVPVTRQLLAILAHNPESFSAFLGVALNMAWALMYLGIQEQKSLSEQHREQLKTMSERLVSHGQKCDSDGSSELMTNLSLSLSKRISDPEGHGVAVTAQHDLSDDQEEDDQIEGGNDTGQEREVSQAVTI